MKRTLLTVGLTALLGLLLTGCEGVNAVTEPPEVSGVCTAANTVDLQLLGDFEVGTEVLGISNWACLEHGDKIRYLWRRPQRAVAARDELIVSMNLNGRWRQSFTFAPDAPGQWTLEVYRNDILAESAPFNIR